MRPPMGRCSTSRSVVVLMKAGSMPPRTPYSLAIRKWRGSRPPPTPRYTYVAYVSFDSLTIAELITCSVVVYLLPLHSDSKRRLKKAIEL